MITNVHVDNLMNMQLQQVSMLCGTIQVQYKRVVARVGLDDSCETVYNTSANLIGARACTFEIFVIISASARIVVLIIEFFGLCECVKHADKEVTSIHCSSLGCTKCKKNI